MKVEEQSWNDRFLLLAHHLVFLPNFDVMDDAMEGKKSGRVYF